MYLKVYLDFACWQGLAVRLMICGAAFPSFASLHVKNRCTGEVLGCHMHPVCCRTPQLANMRMYYP